VRIQGKKLRYAVEFLQALYPRARAAEKRFADAIEELQESLGKLNDMATARTIASVPANDGWLIGSIEERRHLVAAEQALRELKRVGPFWRPDANVHAAHDEALA
jgi:CHAD domain-containing protein